MLTAILIAVTASGAGEAAQKRDRAVLDGTVTDVAGEPLAGVTVAVRGESGSSAGATTDERGRFSIELTAGAYDLGFDKEGYAPFESQIELEAGKRATVAIELLDAGAGQRNEAVRAYNAGVTAYESGDLEAAKTSFLAATRSDPSLAEPHFGLARIRLAEGAHAEAAAAAERFLALRPGDRHAQRIAYTAHRKLGNRDKVVELRAILGADPELAPQLARQVFNEGAAAIKQGDHDLAVASFREALELDPGLAPAHHALAAVYYERDRQEEALAAVDRALELEPASLPGRRLRFLILDVLGRLEEADAAIEAYIELDPGGGTELLLKRAERDFRDGHNERARVGLVRTLELEPDLARAHYLLGVILVSGPVPALAEGHLRRFIELAPDDPDVDVAQDLLELL